MGDTGGLEASWWKHLRVRYPYLAVSFDHLGDETPLWPEWSDVAFQREEQAWGQLSELGRASGTPEGDRWGRQARTAVLRLRGQVWRRRDSPAHWALSALDAYRTASFEPALVCRMLTGLQRFLDQASDVVATSPLMDARTAAACRTLRERLKAYRRPLGVSEQTWVVAMDGALAALARYRDKACPLFIQGSGVVPWLLRAPDPAPFDEARQRLDERRQTAAPLSFSAVRGGLSRLHVPESVESPSSPWALWTLSLAQAWQRMHRPLDSALADPLSYPALVDWATDHMAQSASLRARSGQVSWIWASQRRQALRLADAWLWLDGEDPVVVRRWLALYWGHELAAWWTTWLSLEPGWALGRLLWTELVGWGTMTLEDWPEPLERAPSDSPPYWNWQGQETAGTGHSVSKD